jgi:replicative DNA helicase
MAMVEAVAWRGLEGGSMGTRQRETRVLTVAETLRTIDSRLRAGTETDLRTVPTGLPLLDGVLAGGIHAGELVLLGGAPGVGKTILSLQMARNVARSGGRSIFVCYEHEPTTLLARLLALEAGFGGREEELSQTVLAALSSGDTRGRGLAEIVAENAEGSRALAEVQSYGDALTFVQASGTRTTTDELGALLDAPEDRHGPTVLFVDYLQKIPLHPEPDTEAEKVTRTVEALKDMALEAHVPIVLCSAIDVGGMIANRVRLHHLRGSSAVAFEADVVLMLNEKQKAVSKVHLSYDPVRAASFRDYVVISVEKNRGGPNLLDLEFRKDFAHFRFEPGGAFVSDKLVDERLDESLV